MKKLIFVLLLSISFFIFPLTTSKAESEITGPDIIYKQKNSVLLMEHVLEMYSHNGEAVTLTEDNYTGNGDVPGVYSFTIKSGNITATKEIEVKNIISDKIIAVTKTGSEYTIHINKDKTLTEQEIVKILERIGLYQLLSNDQISKLSDTYTENANSPGTYIFEFRIVNASGNSNQYSTKIVVSRSNTIGMSGDEINMKTGKSSAGVYIVVAVALIGLAVYLLKRK